MPLSRTAFVRSTALALLIGLAALLGIVVASLWLVAATDSYSEVSITVRQQRSTIADLRGLLGDAESGQRGYLLTGDAAYLEPYRQARDGIPALLQRARELLRGDVPEAELARLSQLVADKLAELEQTVTLADAGRREEAMAIVNTERGRLMMVSARETLSGLQRGVEARLFEAIGRQRDSIRALRFATIGGAAIIAVMAIVAIWTVVLYLRQLAQTRRDIEALNASLEERVAERTFELERANAEIQRFAYVVTHDLRAPLVNIMGFTSELETNLASIQALIGQSDENSGDQTVRDARDAALVEVPEAIGFIRSSTRKMDGLINAILKLSREGRRKLKPETIDLRQLLEVAAESLRHQLLDADGEISIEGQAPPIVSDRLALEQVFGNLLDNAVKYRDPARPLRVHIRLSAPPLQRIVVEVEDNGRGIAEDDRERVFELFRRAGAQDQQGEGIGLAHVRALVRNIGGDIALQSELGRGTTFKVLVPRDLTRAIGAQR